MKTRRKKKKQKKKTTTAPAATKSVQDNKHSRKATRKIVGKRKCTVKL